MPSIEAIVFLGQVGLGQGLHTVHGRDILRKRYALRPQFLGRLDARRSLARRDVDLRGARLEKTLGDHLADAARAAGHQRDLTVERKQIRGHESPPFPIVAAGRQRPKIPLGN
jgi:hypothetical protein